MKYMTGRKMTVSRWEKRILLVLSVIGIVGVLTGMYAYAFLSAGTLGHMVMAAICGGI